MALSDGIFQVHDGRSLLRYSRFLCLKPLKKCYTVWEHDPTQPLAGIGEGNEFFFLRGLCARDRAYCRTSHTKRMKRL